MKLDLSLHIDQSDQEVQINNKKSENKRMVPVSLEGGI